MIIDFYNLAVSLALELEEAKKINEISEKALKMAREAAEELSKCQEKAHRRNRKKPVEIKISSNSI